MDKVVKLTQEEREVIYHSLSIRCGFIETGTINRAIDLQKCGQKDKIKVLSSEQMRLINFIEDLMAKVL